MRTWFRFDAKAEESAADLFIFDEIGRSFWNDTAVTAKAFIDELTALPKSVKTINVRVNSPGGDPFDASVIANALRSQRLHNGRQVVVTIEGLAASAATIITCAGNPIRIAANAIFMIHEPFSIEVGTAADMRKMADALDKIRDAIVVAYQWVSPKSTEELVAMMAATTWLDADETIANGFATEKIAEPVDMAARFQPAALARLQAPERYRDRVAAFANPLPLPAPVPVAASAAQVLQICRAGGCLALAEGLISLGATMETVKSRVAHAKEIRAVCRLVNLPDLAEGYITAAVPVDLVKAQLAIVTAQRDDVEIDGGLDPDGQVPRRRGHDLRAKDIYARRNAPAAAPPAGGAK
ncbi:MAG: head maturation protease, ClpP-related [Vicinamibacterales bacterium]